MFLAFIARLSTNCEAVDDQSFATAFKTIIPKARIDNALENAIRTGFVEAAKQDKHPRFLDKLCTDLRNIVGSAIFDHQFESELVCAFDNLQFDTARDFPFRLQCKIIFIIGTQVFKQLVIDGTEKHVFAMAFANATRRIPKHCTCD